MEIDISGLSKAAVLAALYNSSKQQGMGFMHASGRSPMTEIQAEAEIEACPRCCFDYLHGRVMKVDISGDTLWVALYDRDNGHGSAARAINELRASKEA